MAITDPFDSLKPIEEYQEPKALSQSDPYAGLKAVKGSDKELPFYQAPESMTATLLDTIPFGKYMLPEEREKFDYMTDEERQSAVTWAAAGTALFFLGGPLLRGAGRVASSVTAPVRGGLSKLAGRELSGVMANRLDKLAKLPIEDKLNGLKGKAGEFNFRPFNLEERMKSSLAGENFVKEEVEAISKAVLNNDPKVLKDAVLERSFQGKEMSKAWSKYVSPTNEPYGGFALSDDLTKKLTPEVLENRHYTKQFRKVLAKEVLGVKKFPENYDLNVLQKQMTARYGDDAAGKGFEALTENDAVDFITDMLGKPRGYRTDFTSTTGGRWWPASLTPARFVLGSGEQTWMTKSMVYDKLSDAWVNTNRDVFDNILAWNTKLQERGLGKVKFNAHDEFKFSPHEKFTAEESQKAYGILRDIDNIRANKKLPEDEVQRQVTSMINQYNPGTVTRQVIDAWFDFSDSLYGQYVVKKLPQILRKSGDLTDFGHNSVDALMAKLIPEVTKTFSTFASKNGVEKTQFMRTALDGIKELVKFDPKTGVHPWFKSEGSVLQGKVDNLLKELTLSNDKGKFIGYTDHYVPRISMDQDNLMQKWSQALVGQKGMFTRQRASQHMVGQPVNFEEMIAGRILAQAKDINLFPVVDEVVKFGSKLPTHYAEYIEHYISGILNRPSHMDHKVAGFLESTVGGIEQFFGKSGKWDARRVQNLGNTLVDLTYLGGLGFKPFTALRNTFQTLITLPTDLGGAPKDYLHFAKAYTRLWQDKKAVQYLKDIGIVTDYAPELNMRPMALPFGRSAKFQQVRDAAMWMMKSSDRLNRFVAGASALNKWESGIKGFTEITANNVKDVMRKVGATNRNPWVKTEIEDMIRRGKVDEAKAIFVRDVVGDTQFLYGPVDAPTALRKYGTVGKTGLLFQSYFMNLASTMEKWFRSGSFPDAPKLAGGQKAISMLFSNAIAYHMMEKVWGSDSAMRGAFFGPFPTEVNEFMVPAAWTPVYRATRTMAAALQANPEMTSEQAKKLLGSFMIYMPGGVQLKKTWGSTADEGFKGFAKSIINVPKKTEGTLFD